MDFDEQKYGVIILGLLPLTMTLLSHAGGHLYFKPKSGYEKDIEELSNKIKKQWKETKEDEEKKQFLGREIADYLKQNMGKLIEGNNVMLWQEIGGNGEKSKHINEMREYYKVLGTKSDAPSKKLGILSYLMKDIYYGLYMIFWPIIGLIYYIIKQATKTEIQLDDNSVLDSFELVMQKMREDYLLDDEEQLAPSFKKIFLRMPFETLWTLEGGVGNAVKLSWIAFMLFIVSCLGILITAFGALYLLTAIKKYQDERGGDLKILAIPIGVFCFGYLSIIYMNKKMFTKTNGDNSIFDPAEFFKPTTFIMWNILCSFVLYSVQTTKSNSFKANYAFPLNLLLMVGILLAKSRSKKKKQT